MQLTDRRTGEASTKVVVPMSAPDPGLTDLIAAHYRTITTAVIYRDDESDGAHRKGFECVCACGDEYMASTRAGDRTEATVLRRADSAHVALVVEQHTNGRMAELEAAVRKRIQLLREHDGFGAAHADGYMGMNWTAYYEGANQAQVMAAADLENDLRAALEGEQQ